MPSPLPGCADDLIHRRLDEYIAGIEQDFAAQALAFSGPLIYGVDDLVRYFVEELAQREDHHERLVVLLTTSGGYIEVVQRIVETIRHHFKFVSFVVPNYAFSAGTVLVMSGNEIHMDYYSRLGPIDPQVEKNSGMQVPALGYLVQWERLLQKSRDGKLTLHEAQLMIDGFDQAELYKYEQARELSVSLLEDWLAQYKFAEWVQTETHKNPVDEQMRKNRAREIATQLNDTERWHSHGYGISKDVLESEVGLKIDNLDLTPDRCRRIRDYHTLWDDYMQKTQQAAALHVRELLRQIG